MEGFLGLVRGLYLIAGTCPCRDDGGRGGTGGTFGECRRKTCEGLREVRKLLPGRRGGALFLSRCTFGSFEARISGGLENGGC